MEPFPRRGRDGRTPRSVALLMAAVCCALVVVLAVCVVLSHGAGAPDLEPRAALRPSRAAAAGTRSFSVMQLNLCLSGWATCRGWAYPAVVREATTRIRQVRPDAVTLNEGCRRDARDIAEATGYHLRFTRISYGGGRLRCIRPAGRGLFGDAILTEAPIVSDQSRRFHDQDGPEVRRWLCVTTRRGPDVCTAHLEVPRIGAGRPNRGQCAELGRLLVRRAAARPVVFGGDVNRVGTCAPAGFWTATDQAATQDPGIQQVYGSTADFGTPRVSTRPARYTDHDVLVVRADQASAAGRLRRGRDGGDQLPRIPSGISWPWASISSSHMRTISSIDSVAAVLGSTSAAW